jgi:endonuclease YncB( thermonuclease family)
MRQYIMKASLLVSLLLSGCSWKEHSAIDAKNKDFSKYLDNNNQSHDDPISLTLQQVQVNPTQEVVTVKKVIDGDSIVYLTSDGVERTGRFIGVNAPEIKDNQLYSNVAAQFLEELIEGQQIQIEGDSDVMDKYGRYLIHAFISGRSIQSILLMEGLVRVAYLYGDYKYIDQYKQAELIAKETQLNIWSIPNYVDTKNGFDMDIVAEPIINEIENNLNELKDELTNKIKNYKYGHSFCAVKVHCYSQER